RAPRDVAETIDLVGLAGKSDARAGKLSGGQQRRLDVAVALIGDPELLFLDEPTTGFDPSARRHAWEIVRNLADIGKTIFLTTHFMDEAQFLADRLAVLARGEIVAEGTPATIAGRDRMMARIQFRVDDDGADLPSLGQERDEHGTWTIRAEDPTRPLHELTGWAIERGVTFPALEVTRPSLEDVYLEITGGEVDEVE
ncbi:MAG TPA: ABC transporter ATP-binding protein, partial [Actinomycetota bacterium]|nr:ABC transporter ATP-binding protein [Actinomycetota bacterium]